MPDVSVIVAAWNAERTIARAILSACAQQGVSVEVVVVDDASTDGTAAAAAAAARATGDARVRILRQPGNGGPAAARNAAIDVARGAWIAVLDADDALLPGRLAGLVAQATRHKLDIVTDNMWVEDAAGTRRLFIEETLDGAMEPLALAEYVTRNRLFGPRLGDGYFKPIFAADFLRRHALRYDTGTRIGEDFLMVAEAMTLGAAYARVRSAGYAYATGVGSISHRLSRSNVEAMIAADQRIIARHGDRLGAGEIAAWQAHLASLLDGASFVAMVDSLKAGELGALARHAARRPQAIRHFSMPIQARLARAGQALKRLPGATVIGSR
jgi:succinoglycan biosynthesis protein ExoO